MSDNEINEAVARRMGWTICEDDDDGDWHSPGDEHGIGVCTNTLPDYCHSIASAWGIVDHLAKPNTGFVFGLDWRGDEGWWCKMEFGHIDPDVRVYETADTAPMAIVEAFLKLP